MFTLPVDFVDLSLANITDLVEAIKLPLVLVFGVSLGMWLINYVLGLVGRRARGRRG